MNRRCPSRCSRSTGVERAVAVGVDLELVVGRVLVRGEEVRRRRVRRVEVERPTAVDVVVRAPVRKGRDLGDVPLVERHDAGIAGAGVLAGKARRIGRHLLGVNGRTTSAPCGTGETERHQRNNRGTQQPSHPKTSHVQRAPVEHRSPFVPSTTRSACAGCRRRTSSEGRRDPGAVPRGGTDVDQLSAIWAARAASSARLRTPSLWKIRVRCVFTVGTVTSSAAAISAFVWPCLT